MIGSGYACLGIGLASLAMGLGVGWQVRDWKAGRQEATRLHAEALALQGQQRAISAASAQYQAGLVEREARERVVVREVEHVLEKPVYREQCLDDDGLRILTDDVATSNTRRGLSAAMPAASGTVR